MANWCNARLVVIGPRPDVLKFSEQARRRRDSYFRSDMLTGEAQELFSERIEKCGERLARKIYIFQIRNDDGRGYFRKISKSYTKLRFVLVFADPNADDFGSYFIYQGHTRKYLLSDKVTESIMVKHHVDYDSDDEDTLYCGIYY